MDDSDLDGPGPLAPTQDQSPSQASLHGWPSAPNEVHDMILEALVNQNQDNVAQYATVSREWQGIIEAATFRCLKVTPENINKLATLGNRQHLVQKVWLHVELSGYKCCSAFCDNSNELHTYAASDCQYAYIVNQALVDLMNILVTWEEPQQITLELSVQSLSDNKHWFRNLSFGGTKNKSGLDSLENPHRVSDGIHDCKDTAPPQFALWRLFRRTPRAPRLLKIVKPKVVKAFVIRRHTRRLINNSEMKLLVENLIEVENLHWETWVTYESRTDELHQAQDILFVLRKLEQRLSAGESKVKRLSFFQDFNQDYGYYLRRIDEPMESTGVIVSHPRDGDLTLAGTFAQLSVNLNELYISYAIDAAEFLQSCTNGWRWKSLEILVLTAPDLINEPDKVPELLCTAAQVAYGMEKLQTMVLYWRGTRPFTFESAVAEKWQRVATKQGLGNLQFQSDDITKGDILSHGDAIHHLGLPEAVVDELSLGQIRREARPWGFSREWDSVEDEDSDDEYEVSSDDDDDDGDEQ